MKKLFIAFAALSIMMSCKTTEKATAKENSVQREVAIETLFVEANQWELISFNGMQPEEAGFKMRTPVLTINMAEMKAGGNSGCNSFGGKAMVEGNTITFDKVISTKMYCDGVPEVEFFQMIQQPLNYTVKGDVLQFEKDGKVILEYRLKKGE